MPDLFRGLLVESADRLADLKRQFLSTYGAAKKKLSQRIMAEEAKLRASLDDDGATGSVDWRVAFAEVFKNGGFDIGAFEASVNPDRGEIVVFHALSREQLKSIVQIQLGRLRARLVERKIELELSDAALEHFATVGYDPVYGARPMKRLLQRELETVLGRQLLSGAVRDQSLLKGLRLSFG
jgi:hypothetical protein